MQFSRMMRPECFVDTQQRRKQITRVQVCLLQRLVSYKLKRFGNEVL